MSTSQSARYNPLISKLYQSRNNLLDILKNVRGFDISDYEGFSVNELQAMYKNKQMDMLLINSETDKKIFVKYHLDKKIKSDSIYDYIDDLFDIEDINLTYDILFEPYIQIKNLCIIFDITIIIISIYLFLSLIYDIYLIKQYSNYSKFKKIYKIKNIYVLFILVVGYLVLVFLNYLFGYFILLFLINYISKYRYKITSGILYIEIYNNS